MKNKTFNTVKKNSTKNKKYCKNTIVSQGKGIFLIESKTN